MKKISYLGLAAVLLVGGTAFAADENARFRAEIQEGLDIVSAKLNVDVLPDDAPGALGQEVYITEGAVNSENTRMFIPTSMYVRMGAGYNLGFATDKATLNTEGNALKLKSQDSWTAQLGLGWNLSSFVRTELDFQNSTFYFTDGDYKMGANYQTVGAMLYFDFARRYVQTGDITYRRSFVPFMGLGAGLGQYAFETNSGADGFVIAAPRAVLGFNVMLNDLIGIDFMYQYQMMIGNGFGWDVGQSGVNNISNIMVSIRANF